MSERAAGAVSVDAVRSYLQAIGRTPLLSAAEEVDLAQRIEVGVLAGERMRQAREGERAVSPAQLRDLRHLKDDGGRARTRLLESNLRLVVSIAKRYSGRGMPFLDLVQEGNIGLMRAIERFDYARGYKFSTYATWWIRQAVNRAMADQSRIIRIPAHKAEAITRMAMQARELLVRLGRDPTADELATELSSTPDEVLELQRLAREPLSLDLTVTPDGEVSLGDLVADGNATAAVDAATFSLMQREITAVLATLPNRDAAVIRLRYGLTDGRPRTLDEIGQFFGVTRERIRQIEARTMTKLRHPAYIRTLRDYLD